MYKIKAHVKGKKFSNSNIFIGNFKRKKMLVYAFTNSTSDQLCTFAVFESFNNVCWIVKKTLCKSRSGVKLLNSPVLIFRNREYGMVYNSLCLVT